MKRKMKMGKIMLMGVLLMLLPALALAAELTATATIATAVGVPSLPEPVIRMCDGATFASSGSDPWGSACSTATALSFGNLSSVLADGTTGAGCFYAPDFFVVYLYPYTEAGQGYVINQTAISSSETLMKALVFTPVYAKEDKYSATGSAQGDLTDDEDGWNPEINVTKLAGGGSSTGGTQLQVFKSNAPRIVRAEYGIPPFAGGTDTRPTGWTAIPLSTLAGSYSVTITIDIQPVTL
ncbi:MAG: hypothetical protein WC469_04735 [Candidatus Omnitrophota bacterium]